MSQIDKLKEIIFLYEKIIDNKREYLEEFDVGLIYDIKSLKKDIKKISKNLEGETTVNTTLKVKNHNVTDLENWLNEKFNLISFSHLQNTDKMYNEDNYFKKVLKQYKEVKKRKDEYIIKNNYKFK